MRVIIEGTTLPGWTFCDPDGAELTAENVGVQVRREPCELVPDDVT